MITEPDYPYVHVWASAAICWENLVTARQLRLHHFPGLDIDLCSITVHSYNFRFAKSK